MPAMQDAPPVKVQIVETEQAPIERRTTSTTYSVGTSPVDITPISNKLIHTLLSVTGNNVYLCIDYDTAQKIGQGTFAAGSTISGSILVTGVYELKGTGKKWLVASTGNTNVGVISEYEV